MNIFEKAVELLENGESFAFATIITQDGSTPRSSGSKMIITKNDTFFTIGGGGMEGDVIRRAREDVFLNKKPVIHFYCLRGNEAADTDFICGGICGVIIGFMIHFLENMKANPFFRTIAAAFAMALPAYLMGAAGLCHNADAAIIGALMILVPGLLFTNAMRDIIYGDTTSGVNRIVQVFLTAAALSLGTAAAWRLISDFIGIPTDTAVITSNAVVQCLFCFIGCIIEL